MNLHEGISALGLNLPTHSEQKLRGYLALLSKWNRVYNLTAIRDVDQMVSHHLLDSLAVLPHLGAIATLADVGSGAGLPGLTFAICRPDLHLTSVEANQKKAAFQQQVKIELGLPNLNVRCERVESLVGSFDAVISRAFADLSDFVRMAGHLSHRLLAMKGVYPKDELNRLTRGWQLADAITLDVPGLNAERHLIVLEKI